MSDKTDKSSTHLPETLPVCPVRGSVIYPSMVMPIDAGRPVSIRAIDAALAQERMILIVSQRDKDVEEPAASDLFEVGTACNVLRMRKNADGSVHMQTLLASMDGRIVLRTRGRSDDPWRLGVELAQDLLFRDGGAELLSNHRIVPV